MAHYLHPREQSGPRQRGPLGPRVAWLLVQAMLGATALAQAPDQETRLSQESPAAPSEPAAAPPEVAVTEAPESLADLLPTRLEAQIAFTNLVAETRYEEAVPVGQRLLELTGEEFGVDSNQSALVRASLAEVQRRLGQFEAAEANLLAALDTIRANDGTFAEAAIAPLVSLGSTYSDAGDYLNALSAFSEARTINRRVFGLLNEAQFPLMDRMTDTLYSMGRIEDADQLQLDALKLAERKRGADSPELVEALYDHAAWLGHTGRHQEERQTYGRAIEILRVHYGESSPTLVTPLRGIGNSFREQRLDEGQGLGALRRALEIVELQSDPDPLALAEVLRDLGDWSVAFSRLGPTGDEYRRAWQVLGELPNAAALRDQWFRGPEFVLREPISQRGVSQDPGAPAGFVLVQFDIDTAGRPENVVVLESHPPGFKDDAILRAIRRSRFRPQMRDGEILRGEKLALRFAFNYDEGGDDERS